MSWRSRRRRIQIAISVLVTALVTPTVFLGSTSAHQTTAPVVVLSRIDVSYPAIAESARVSGTVTVRVGVRSDGSAAETTVLQDVPLLSAASVKAASGATFECRRCTESVTPHTIVFD